MMLIIIVLFICSLTTMHDQAVGGGRVICEGEGRCVEVKGVCVLGIVRCVTRGR